MRRFLAALLSVTIVGSCAAPSPERRDPATIATQEAQLRLPDGEVTSVKWTDVGRFVAISVGSRAGVRVGDGYHISRGDDYVGWIKIIRVSEESAYGLLDQRWQSVRLWPKPGDRVWTE